MTKPVSVFCLSVVITLVLISAGSISSQYTCDGTFGSTGICPCTDATVLLAYHQCYAILDEYVRTADSALIANAYTYLCYNNPSDAVYSVVKGAICPCKALPGTPCTPAYKPTIGTSIQSVTVFYLGTLPNIIVTGVTYTDTLSESYSCGTLTGGSSVTRTSSYPGHALGYMPWYYNEDAQLAGFDTCWVTANTEGAKFSNLTRVKG
jgi:hypothetical protein